MPPVRPAGPMEPLAARRSEQHLALRSPHGKSANCAAAGRSMPSAFGTAGQPLTRFSANAQAARRRYQTGVATPGDHRDNPRWRRRGLPVSVTRDHAVASRQRREPDGRTWSPGSEREVRVPRSVRRRSQLSECASLYRPSFASSACRNPFARDGLGTSPQGRTSGARSARPPVPTHTGIAPPHCAAAGVILSGRANPWKDTQLPASGSRWRCVKWRVRREATRRSRKTEEACIWNGRRIQVGLADRTAELPGRNTYARTVVPRMDPADGPGNRRRAQSDAISGIVKRAVVRQIRQSAGSPCLS